VPRLAVRYEQGSTCLERTRRFWAPRPPLWRCTRLVRRDAVTPRPTSSLGGLRLEAAGGTAAQRHSRRRAGLPVCPANKDGLPRACCCGLAPTMLGPAGSGATPLMRENATALQAYVALQLLVAVIVRPGRRAPGMPPRAVSPPGWAGTGRADSAVIATGARSPPGVHWRSCSALRTRHRGRQAAAVSEAGCQRGWPPPQASQLTGARRRRHGTPGGCSPPRRRRMRTRARGRCSRRAWQARSSCLWVRSPCSRRPAAPRARLADV